MTQSETPIFDALFLERAVNDQEGRDLVHAIHVRKGYLPPAGEAMGRNAYAFRAEPRLLVDPLERAYGRLAAELGLEP